ncbi:YciI family protein [Paenibacillus hexagrammi]|uniref:YciI family protein n=1 Tax=Paenibacillus hexagrammi TaxID=2908839 RepID=A0ABY3SLL3_9BACL|nr:YciI family protein [Paenibacillus sp. YPD9-1]UJF34430.1 YciI family protein [Paenibacillus sp. YPD9-1]
MKYFAVLLPMKDEELSKEHRPAHLEYLEQRRSEGKIFANGRFVDGWGGLVIYKAESLEEAKQLAAEDPFVKLGARDCQVHEWDIVIS